MNLNELIKQLEGNREEAGVVLHKLIELQNILYGESPKDLSSLDNRSIASESPGFFGTLTTENILLRGILIDCGRLLGEILTRMTDADTPVVPPTAKRYRTNPMDHAMAQMETALRKENF